MGKRIFKMGTHAFKMVTCILTMCCCILIIWGFNIKNRQSYTKYVQPYIKNGLSSSKNGPTYIKNVQSFIKKGQLHFYIVRSSCSLGCHYCTHTDISSVYISFHFSMRFPHGKKTKHRDSTFTVLQLSAYFTILDNRQLIYKMTK